LGRNEGPKIGLLPECGWIKSLLVGLKFEGRKNKQFVKSLMRKVIAVFLISVLFSNREVG
jgi:hypothetical protein